MGKPEGKIENYLKTQAEALGFICWKFTAPSTDGVPDRVLIGYGKTAFVETKREGGAPRKLQEITIKEMREHGALVYVADTKELIDQLLNELMNS